MSLFGTFRVFKCLRLMLEHRAIVVCVRFDGFGKVVFSFVKV